VQHLQTSQLCGEILHLSELEPQYIYKASKFLARCLEFIPTFIFRLNILYKSNSIKVCFIPFLNGVVEGDHNVIQYSSRTS